VSHHRGLTGAAALAIALCTLAADALAQAPRPERRPGGVGVMLRLDAGALNPKQLDGTTMCVGASAGLVFRGRTALFVRFLRQSLDGNSPADLSRPQRDIVSLMAEHAWGRGRHRPLWYFVRGGAGLMYRKPRETSPVATAGLGARYQAYPGLALVGSVELSAANLIGGAYETAEWNPDLGRWMAVRTPAKLQPNYGFLLAVEWRPVP
jgi:hypothetical protein